MISRNNIHVLLTGGTSGIGKAAAIELAAHGVKLVLVARNPIKAQATLDEIAQRTGRQDIVVLTGDVSSLTSVQHVACKYRERFERLDVLINNAGVFLPRRHRSPDGFELTFATNYLGPIALTHALLDLLRASAPARIVFTTSIAEMVGKVHVTDLQLTRGYNGLKAYAQTKLANLLVTYDLARQLTDTGVTVNAFHPGLVRTNIGEFQTNPILRFLTPLSIPLTLKAEIPGHTLAELAINPAYAGVTGRYITNNRTLRGSHAAHDAALQDYLRHVTADLLAIDAHPCP